MFPAHPSRTPRPTDHRQPGRRPGLISAVHAPVLRVLAVAVILGAAGLASVSAPASAQIDGTVSGTVQDTSGKPLADAVVELRRNLTDDLVEYHRATSDAEGGYSASGLDAGTWVITVRLDGYRTNESTFSLSTGESQTFDVALRSMFEAHYIATLVSADNETPIAGAIATVTSHDGQFNERSATSDADGKLSLRLFDSDNQIRITKSGYQTYNDWVWNPRNDVERTIYMQTAPEQTVTIIGKVVNDATGAPVKSWIDLNPDWNAIHHPEGRADSDGSGTSSSTASPDQTEPAGDAIAPGEPYPYYPQQNNHNNTITDDDGAFTMNASPGAVVLSANRQGYLVEEVRTTLTDGQTWTVEIRLVPLPERSVTITGIVTDADSGDPIEGASVSAQVPESGDNQWAQTDKDGRYTLEVRPGHTLIEVRHWGYPIMYAETTAVDAEGGGDAEIMPSPAPKEPGREYHPQVQTLDTEANSNHDLRHALTARPEPTSTLVGYVIDAETSKAIANARVSIENHDSRDWGSATTDANGSYRFELYAGYHTVSVHIDGYLPTRVNVQVPDDGNARQDLTVQPGTWANEGWWNPDGYRDECCIAYAEDGAKEGSYDGGESSPQPASAPARSTQSLAGDSDESSSTAGASSGTGGNLRGSGGGLPPYDPASTGETFEDQESPSVGAFALVMTLGALALVVGLRRRN